MITTTILKQLAPLLPDNKEQAIVDALNSVCPLYGISTPDIMHEFLANLLLESIEFTDYEENLHYSAKRLMEVWPKRFPTFTDTIGFVNNPEALANKVYGGRLGNVKPTDGWDFRGSGPIQMTGRGNFEAFAKWMSSKFARTMTAEQWAAAVRIDPIDAIHSACWIFAIAKKLIPLAVDDRMKDIVYRINGGYNGLSQRMHYYELCKKLIV